MVGELYHRKLVGLWVMTCQLLEKYAQLANTLGTHLSSDSHPVSFSYPHTSPFATPWFVSFFFFPAGIAMWQSQSWVSEKEVEIVNEATVFFFPAPLSTDWDYRYGLPHPTPQANFLFLLPRYSTWWHGVLEIPGKAKELAFIQCRKECMYMVFPTWCRSWAWSCTCAWWLCVWALPVLNSELEQQGRVPASASLQPTFYGKNEPL